MEKIKVNINDEVKLWNGTEQCTIPVVSRCAFLVYVEDTGKLIVIAKDEEEVSKKMKEEGFTKPFKIMTALSFIA